MLFINGMSKAHPIITKQLTRITKTPAVFEMSFKKLEDFELRISFPMFHYQVKLDRKQKLIVINYIKP